MAARARTLIVAIHLSLVLWFTADLVRAASLTFIQARSNGSGAAGLGGAADVAISPDGRHVYVAGRADNAVAVFGRDELTGRLTFIEAKFQGVDGVDGIGGARALAVSPDGKNLYVAGFDDNALAVFSRDPVTGALTFVEAMHDGVDGVDGLAGANGVAMSSDGRNVYVAGFFEGDFAGSGKLAVFSRDLVTGALSFLQAAGAATFCGCFLNTTDVTVSPDGGYVYTTSMNFQGSVAVLIRDPDTGSLAFIDALSDGTRGVDTFSHCTSVTISPDSKDLFVVSGGSIVQGDDALSVLARNPASGTLTLRQAFRDNLDGIEGLGSAAAVAVSSDGARLYVAGPGDNGVAVFGRDPTTGVVGFVEARLQGQDGIVGIAGASGVAISPDDAHVYVTGAQSSSVAAFKVESSACGDAVHSFPEQCDEGVANGTSVSCCEADCTLRAAGAVCRPSSDSCDISETCDGVHAECAADGVAARGETCRAQASFCDVAENCDGVSRACPPDRFTIRGTPCADGDLCTIEDSCQAGSCTGGVRVCSVKLEPVQKASIGSLLQGKKAAAVINCLLQGPARDGSCSAKGILAAASPGSRSTGSARQTEGICVGRSVTRSKIKIVESPEGALFVIRLKLNPNRLSRAVLRRLVREGAVIDVCTTVAAPNIRDVTLVTRVQLTSCPNRPGPASVLQVCGREVS